MILIAFGGVVVLGLLLFFFSFWLKFLGGFTLLALMIYYSHVLRKKYPGVNSEWANAVMPIIGFLALHIGLWWLWPNFFAEFYGLKGVLLLEILLVIGLYTMNLGPKVPKSAQAVGWMLVIFSCIGLLLRGYDASKNFIEHNPNSRVAKWLKSKDEPTRYTDNLSGTVTSTLASETYAFPSSLRNNEDAKVMYDYFATNLHPAREAFEMFTTCGKESSYRQFEADGVTPLLGKTDIADTGICQINERIWGEKSDELGYDINTLEGNLKMALWIREHEGLGKWKKMREAKEATSSILAETFTAPTPEEGWKQTPVTVGFNFDSNGPVKIRANGSYYDYSPGMRLHLPDSAYIEYQSAAPAGQPVTVFVSRKR
jgi:hypothetical protein